MFGAYTKHQSSTYWLGIKPTTSQQALGIAPPFPQYNMATVTSLGWWRRASLPLWVNYRFVKFPRLFLLRVFGVCVKSRPSSPSPWTSHSGETVCRVFAPHHLFDLLRVANELCDTEPPWWCQGLKSSLVTRPPAAAASLPQEELCFHSQSTPPSPPVSSIAPSNRHRLASLLFSRFHWDTHHCSAQPCGERGSGAEQEGKFLSRRRINHRRVRLCEQTYLARRLHAWAVSPFTASDRSKPRRELSWFSSSRRYLLPFWNSLFSLH